MFRAGQSEFSVELHYAQVPVVDSTPHWPVAASALANHAAYLDLSATNAAHGLLRCAGDLMRAIGSLIPTTDWLAVCWLHWPFLNTAKVFMSTAREMLAAGLYPLQLWAAVRWDSGARTLTTQGMDQFWRLITRLSREKRSIVRMGCSKLRPDKSAQGKRLLILKPS